MLRWALALISLFYLITYLVRRMLVGQTSRVSRGRISAIAPSALRASTASCHAPVPTMFRRAVNDHVASKTPVTHTEKENVPPKSSTENWKALGNPINGSLHLTSKASLAPARKPLHSYLSVKRTASGLAKALGAQENEGFQDEPDLHKTQSNLVNTESFVLFEDDFDSDVELEVEKPIARQGVSYPKLPVTYPPVPQRAQMHTDASSYQVSEALPQPPSQGQSQSTQLLPWSSSPDFHKQPPGENNTFVFASKELSRQQPESQKVVKATETTVESDSRPKKRRVLPWMKENREEIPQERDESEQLLAETSATTQTPNPKKSSSTFPWISTASAIKEQQKQLRKATKKTAKDEQPLESSQAAPIKVNARKSSVMARPMLSKEQRHVLDLVVEHGKSVFFTGSAGTGKSVLLREIITVLRKRHAKEADRVAVTASTGLAACNIGGVTLHSFAGIGLGKESVPELVKKIKRNQKAKHRWMRTKVLIVDEVSMVDGELFDKLEAIARTMRNNARPFGGIQLIITGDFFQLPPVPDNSGRVSTFAFDAKQWDSAIHHTIGLHHVFRQKDAVFASMLNEMREGHLSQSSIETFRSLSRPLIAQPGDDREATELFPTRVEVDSANNAKMQQLSGGLMVYEAKDGGAIIDKEQRAKLLSNCMAAPELVLKKGAQVMLIKNIDENLVNGSLGKVHSFMTEDMFNAYDGNPGLFSTPRDSDEEEEMNPQRMKDRLKLDALKASTGQLWPMVRFMIADGTTRDLLCTRESWKVELPNGEVQACRSQVPLILAWALSIHKAQGQTLEKVRVDLGRVFEKGQAYVALSRATSIDGLQVLRFDPGKVKAHDRVRSFYSSLSRAESGAAA